MTFPLRTRAAACVTTWLLCFIVSSSHALAYELTPHCRPFFGSWPHDPLLQEEMIRLDVNYNRQNPNTNQLIFGLYPPQFTYQDLFIYGGTAGTPSPELRLAMAWAGPFPGWPNTASSVTYEVLEDHFSEMDNQLHMKVYVGREFIWIESISDLNPNKVTTSPMFFGVGDAHLNDLAYIINFYDAAPELWANGIVTNVHRCRYPIRGRFETVINDEYARNESPLARSSLAHKAANAWQILFIER